MNSFRSTGEIVLVEFGLSGVQMMSCGSTRASATASAAAAGKSCRGCSWGPPGIRVVPDPVSTPGS